MPAWPARVLNALAAAILEEPPFRASWPTSWDGRWVGRLTLLFGLGHLIIPGSDARSGRAFGPEAPPIAVAVSLLAAAVVAPLAMHRIPP